MIKKIIEYLVKALVDMPQVVAVEVVQGAGKNQVKITVAEADLGRVIGKDGQTIRAIRALVSSIIPAGQEVTIDVSK